MAKQILHLVFGGELKAGLIEFAGLGRLDIVAIYPDYKTAYAAWRGAVQKTVDDATYPIFIVHLHRLLDPNTDASRSCDHTQLTLDQLLGHDDGVAVDDLGRAGEAIAVAIAERQTPQRRSDRELD
jgi:Domain of unknown function (DUF4170)